MGNQFNTINISPSLLFCELWPRLHTDPDKMLFSAIQYWYILFLYKSICCVYSLEAPCSGPVCSFKSSLIWVYSIFWGMSVQILRVNTCTVYTVITLSIGTDRSLQTVLTQIRCRSMRHLIRVYTVCLIYSNISDTSTGSRMYHFFKF